MQLKVVTYFEPFYSCIHPRICYAVKMEKLGIKGNTCIKILNINANMIKSRRAF
jgi:hypothetical protein